MKQLRTAVGVAAATLLLLASPADAAGHDIDCDGRNPDCRPLVIAGETPAAGNFSGTADPSIRRDPATGDLWMAYSHLAPDADGSADVGTRLATSTDGGATWHRRADLWQPAPVRDDRGRAGHLNSEAVSITTDGSRWYSARMSYFTTGGDTPTVTSITTRIAVADHPRDLATAPEQVLGGDLTAAYWRPDRNLAAGRPELAGCTFFDAGILATGGSLVMAVECERWDGEGNEDTEHSFVAVFATDPAGPVAGWDWRYLGPLAGHAEATELGAELLLQADLVRDRDGRLLVILSPSGPGGVLATHEGCRVLEVADLAHPRLARENGRLVVRASVTASDLAPFGPGSCGYDPASATGITIARRHLGEDLIISSLTTTGVHP